MIHMRIVAPEDAAHSVLDLLCASPAVINVAHPVVWEEVEARTSEQTELSVSFVLFMVAAMQTAAVGFPIGIVMALLTSLLFIGLDVFPQDFSEAQHPFTEFISEPDFLSFFVAFVAGSEDRQKKEP